MNIYFSKSANGFFIEGLSPAIPADKVLISESVWQRLLTNQSPASQISSDADGNPILIDTTNGNAVVYTSVGQT